MGLNLSLS